MTDDNDDEMQFDLEAMLEESLEDEGEEWQFELNEEGDLMDMATFSKKDIAKAVALSVFIHIIEIALLIGLGFILVLGVTFLMNVFGVAIPVQ